MLQRLQADLVSALKASDSLTSSVLRLLISAGNYKRIELGRELNEADWVSVINKEIKQRKESIEAYQNTRPDLSEGESKELAILERYLPAQLSDLQLRELVQSAISETGAHQLSDMGKVIARVKERAGTGADGGRISQEVRSLLGI
jgi:uncharacterized protein